MSAPAKTGKKQDTRFKKGKSGNPQGRPQGSRNKATLLAQGLMEEQLFGVVEQVVNAALAGDLPACKLVLDKLIPNAKDRPIDPGSITLPVLKGSNLAAAQAAVARALAGGRLTPSEADALGRALEQHRKAVELVEIEQRLARVEQAMEAKK